MNDLTSFSTEKITKRLQKLRSFTATEGNGVTRLPFSSEGRRAAEYLLEEMNQIGLISRIDLVGNVRGVLSATVAPDEAKTIIMGSHYDTVKNGGEYDGIAGVVCALSVAEYLSKYVPLRNYNFEVIAFNDEEGCMFGSGCLGSKSLTGQVDQQYISHLTDENGISIKEWMTRWGADPDCLSEQFLDVSKLRAFFEIHIEQGPVLDKASEEIGVVTGIVGLLRCMATVSGRADHAGTTPMDMRQDSLLIASKVISRLDGFATDEGFGAVATSGFIRAYPNAMNVVAEKTEFTMDLRSIYDESIDNMERKIRLLLDGYTQTCNASYDIDVKLRQPSVTMDPTLVSILSDKCENHNFRYRRMHSGAAHDAMIFADKIPTAMVFVPSKNGRSHCPEEFSKYEDLAKATQIVFETISELMTEGEY